MPPRNASAVIEEVAEHAKSNEAAFAATLGVLGARSGGRSELRKVTIEIFRRIAQLCDLSGGRNLTKLTGFGLQAFHFVSITARSGARRRRAEHAGAGRAAAKPAMASGDLVGFAMLNPPYGLPPYDFP